METVCPVMRYASSSQYKFTRPLLMSFARLRVHRAGHQNPDGEVYF